MIIGPSPNGIKFAGKRTVPACPTKDLALFPNVTSQYRVLSLRSIGAFNPWVLRSSVIEFSTSPSPRCEMACKETRRCTSSNWILGPAKSYSHLNDSFATDTVQIDSRSSQSRMQADLGSPVTARFPAYWQSATVVRQWYDAGCAAHPIACYLALIRRCFGSGLAT